MNNILAALLALTLLAFIDQPRARAGDSAVHKPEVAAFERLKALEGEWRGHLVDSDEKGEVAVRYRVTANGHSVVETLFPGTPHEMITVYYLEKRNLVLVHYCGAGNQPRMALKKSSPDRLEFDFAGGANVKPRKDAHMHAMRMQFRDADRLETEWDFFKEGKKVSVTKFSVSRQKHHASAVR